MSNTRQIAFEALFKVTKSEAYSNITLDGYLSKTELDTRDKAFVSALFYGTIERKLTIDYQLALFLDKPLKKLRPEVLTILELGAYQILFMDKVPASAAVNESVRLTKKNGCSFAAGLVNAVLRKVDRNGVRLPSKDDLANYLSVKYSCPTEYVNIWLKELGEEATVKLLESSLGSPEVAVRVNTIKTTSEKLISLLADEGVEAVPADVENALLLTLNSKDIEKLEAFRNGLFHVQDLSCQKCAKALLAKEGQIVFDMCSAPGGKAFTLAEIMNDNGKVCCFDIHDSRVKLILDGAYRLGLNSVSAGVSDAAVFDESLGMADAVLCDVPCSGLGIIGRKPEIKYKSLESLEDLPKIQYKILKNASRYVKKNGLLLYSTCTILNRENSDVCEKFLADNPDFTAVNTLSEYKDRKYITLLPGTDGGDGFFIAVFKRKG